MNQITFCFDVSGFNRKKTGHVFCGVSYGGDFCYQPYHDEIAEAGWKPDNAKEQRSAAIFSKQGRPLLLGALISIFKIAIDLLATTMQIHGKSK